MTAVTNNSARKFRSVDCVVNVCGDGGGGGAGVMTVVEGNYLICVR